MFPVSHEINILPSSLHRVISKKAPVMNGSFSGKSWKKITQRANLEIIIKKLVGNHQMPTIRMWAQLICSTPKPSWCCELWFLVKLRSVKHQQKSLVVILSLCQHENCDMKCNDMKSGVESWYCMMCCVYHTVETWWQNQRCRQDMKKRQMFPFQTPATT